MRRMPPLNAIQAFEAAVRHSSVREAARELDRSPNAISHQIRRLEEYFDVKLFERSKGRIKVNRAASTLGRDMKSAFDLIAAATERFADGVGSNTITLNSTQSFALQWLIPRLAEFERQNPDISIALDTEALDGAEHLNQPYDFIFRKNHLRLRGYAFRRLMPDCATPTASPELLKVRTIYEPDDVLRHTMLHMKTRPITWHAWLSEYATLNSDVVPGPYYDYYFLAIEAAKAGLGFALIPHYLINEEISSGQLVAPFPDYAVIAFGLYMTFRKNVTEFPHKLKLLEYLMDCARQTHSEPWLPAPGQGDQEIRPIRDGRPEPVSSIAKSKST